MLAAVLDTLHMQGVRWWYSSVVVMGRVFAVVLCEFRSQLCPLASSVPLSNLLTFLNLFPCLWKWREEEYLY